MANAGRAEKAAPDKVMVRVLPGRRLAMGRERDEKGRVIGDITKTHADGFFKVDATELESPGFRKSVETKEDVAAFEATVAAQAKSNGAGVALFDSLRETKRAHLHAQARVRDAGERRDAQELLAREPGPDPRAA